MIKKVLMVLVFCLVLIVSIVVTIIDTAETLSSAKKEMRNLTEESIIFADKQN